MDYSFRDIEKRWQNYWREQKTFAVNHQSQQPAFYVLDMFPYPSGSGLHVGHPLGYIASDIVARFKRLQGYNVLHPMGYDAFGLPAEQYAIQTGQHPAITTEKNCARYREQLDRIGFSFDWDREIRTSDPAYYKWTQWIFLQLFKSWYNHRTQRAEPIETLIALFEKEGYTGNDDRIVIGDGEASLRSFTADEWKKFSEKEHADILMNFRLAYLGEAWVNWCAALGTVLANDEVKDGVSERGGHPVERKRMPQWSLRITAYAERLLQGLDTIDWSESVKEIQRNWIGRSQGSSLRFAVHEHNASIDVFTTRPDTVFGVSFLTLAPEHELIERITTPEYLDAVRTYTATAKNKSERERQADVKQISGQFTGAYAIHPFTGKKIPIWIGEYVLAGYGTGAVMAVPAHDSRDYAFARHFNLPIVEVVSGGNITSESYDAKEGTLINSDFLNGLGVKAAISKCITEIETRGLGKGKINYRLRDAAFGRQRYWGEPIPIYYKDGIALPVDEADLPVVLPEVDAFQPTETGEPPLARTKNWKYKNQYNYETTTMPGWAGSSWYFLRYMDPHNATVFVSPEAVSYWKNIDLYLGGAEHATGHLLYVRFWTKFLNDRGWTPTDEPVKKLINQGMIQGTSMLAHVKVDRSGEDEKYMLLPKHESVREGETFHKNYLIDFVDFQDGKYILTEEGAAKTRARDAAFRNYYLTGETVELTPVVEKMSKSKYNVVSPDAICDQYGADTLRLYEMFLGPLEQHKPWNTNGISGVHNFIKRFWRLFFNESGFSISDDVATDAELKILHRTLKKVIEDSSRYSFNTCVSTFMIAVNELMDLKCRKRSILEPLTVLLSPFAPHIAEELWSKLGHNTSISKARLIAVDENYLTDTSFDYPVQINGKMRFKFTAPVDMSPADVEQVILLSEEAKKWLDGKAPKKFIVVPKRIVNIVI
jgi:leucyl-tRNA synthetase